MIIGAVIAIETKNLLAAIISLGAVGVGSSIAFLILQAPDLAITQIVVEVLCLIILIRATLSRDITTVDENREFFGLAVVVIIIVTTFIFGIEIMRELPHFGKPLLAEAQGTVSQHYLRNGLKETGAANLVASVILDYRGYDTLGEATVLFTAIIGTLAILRKKSRKK
jgi:multisubunit Na+/H+ antiporter MnhB subunit